MIMLLLLLAASGGGCLMANGCKEKGGGALHTIGLGE